jgi:hypothetical protein
VVLRRIDGAVYARERERERERGRERESPTPSYTTSAGKCRLRSRCWRCCTDSLDEWTRIIWKWIIRVKAALQNVGPNGTTSQGYTGTRLAVRVSVQLCNIALIGCYQITINANLCNWDNALILDTTLYTVHTYRHTERTHIESIGGNGRQN